MHVGRRHFLKFLGSSILGVNADTASSIFSSPTHFIDKKLGFGFKRPSGWYLETFREDFKELLGGQQLAEGFRDEETLDELSQGLMATLSKYPIVGDPQKRFSPSVTFFSDTDCSVSDYPSLLDLAHDAISGFSTVLTAYECYDCPKYIDRDDCVMVRSKSKFLFEHEEINPTLIDNETFLIHYNNLIYTIHLYDSPYTNDTSQNEFNLFKDSLHIA